MYWRRNLHYTELQNPYLLMKVTVKMLFKRRYSYEKLGTLKEEKFFKTWLTRILINICFRMAKKRKNVISFEDYMPDDISDSSGELSDIREAVMSLPLKIRTVIVLYYIEGYSIEETGYMMKIPAGTVKSRLHKGRNLLREMLKDTDL